MLLDRWNQDFPEPNAYLNGFLTTNSESAEITHAIQAGMGVGRLQKQYAPFAALYTDTYHYLFGPTTGGTVQPLYGLDLGSLSTKPPGSPLTISSLHGADLTGAQRTQLGFAATTPSGTDTSDLSQIPMDATLRAAYTTSRFLFRHELDFVRVGLPGANPDTWPAGETGLAFVAFDVFDNAEDAAAAADAAVSDLKARFTELESSPVGLGETILQFQNGGVTTTIVILQRGSTAMKAAFACNGCPVGPVPADVKAFVDAQIQQAVAAGVL